MAAGIIINCCEQNAISRTHILACDANLSHLRSSSNQCALFRPQSAVEFFCELYNNTKQRWRSAQERSESPDTTAPTAGGVATAAATAAAPLPAPQKTYGRAKKADAATPTAATPTNAAPAAAVAVAPTAAQAMESQIAWSYCATLLGCLVRFNTELRSQLTRTFCHLPAANSSSFVVRRSSFVVRRASTDMVG